jgi:arsenate reductase-like glutaredoxin family protein
MCRGRRSRRPAGSNYEGCCRNAESGIKKEKTFMNIQIFGSSKSFDSKKAERWFRERRIKYQYIDLPSKGLSPREYQSVKQKIGFEALVNTKCRAYETLFMAYITPEAQEEKLLEHPELFLTPIVRSGKNATVGYCPDVWETWE